VTDKGRNNKPQQTQTQTGLRKCALGNLHIEGNPKENACIHRCSSFVPWRPILSRIRLGHADIVWQCSITHDFFSLINYLEYIYHRYATGLSLVNITVAIRNNQFFTGF
jgi:hypothetical protein